MAENASLFLTYGEFQRVIRKVYAQDPSEKLDLSQLALAAAGAGAFTSFVLTPIELVKCKMQVQMLAPVTSSSSSPMGPFAIIRSTIATSGLRGLWLGQTGTLIRETGGTAAWFSTKEFVAARLIEHRLATNPQSVTYASSHEGKPQLLIWESALSGSIAGAAFNFALFPADTVKSTMQTQDELHPKSSANAKKANFFRTFKDIWKAQGVRGLYAGCGVTVARSIPSSAIIFVIYDQLSKRFG
ncbi:hypothetical protein ONZ45_g13716 [Pleurotus djamor]|nr:hypothetical protein ONZ45_g13716 [Pleurotus djamor]